MTLVAAYAEGSGLSLLQTGEAIAAVARNPGQFIDGVRALITSSQARQQLGEAIINRINYDLREFNHAYNTGDWRRAGQQFGLMVNALTQAAGGAQGLARGAQAAARGGARLAGRGLEALADAVANAKPATARLRQTGGVRIPSAAEINKSWHGHDRRYFRQRLGLGHSRYLVAQEGLRPHLFLYPNELR